jgi:hypothetical protein
MKCAKCRYSSFPHLKNCPKCGFGLAEQRAAFGVYALPPDPPDLLLAYQAATMAATAETQAPDASATAIDVGELEGIDLEIAEVEPDVAGADELELPANAAPDMMSTLGRKGLEEKESAPLESSSERLSSQEISLSQSLDANELGDLTLAIEDAEEGASDSLDSSPAPGASAAVSQVYDLDLDEDLDGLDLGSIGDKTRADDGENADDEAVEYTLEIEEDVEFEIDELELEQDDEDDDTR